MATTVDPEKPKFIQLRDLIRDQILSGVFADGQTLPTEADFSAQHSVSRVTVRKALDALKKESIITSVRGSGTMVSLRRHAFKGALDMVVLVAPLYSPFFSLFFRHFESTVDRNGTIVIFKQDHARTAMASADFYARFVGKGIRDFVLWPGAGFEGGDLLPRLRGLGLNLVFFDHLFENEYADGVGLHNRDAIASLHAELQRQRCKRVDFIGWDDVPLSSTEERIQGFKAVAGPSDRLHLVSKYGASKGGEDGRPSDFEPAVRALIKKMAAKKDLPDGIITLNGSDLGRTVAQILVEEKLRQIRIGTVDEIAAVPDLSITCYVQPIKKMAEKVFQCLLDQNRLGERWKAGRYAVKGTLKILV
jgi:DNA-binding LacI/PurR family transcriptional regulator